MVQQDYIDGFSESPASFGLWAIELNLAEWEQEYVEELGAPAHLT